MNQAPILAVNDTILWLKVVISAATLVLLYVRYRRGKRAHAAHKGYAPITQVVIVLAVLFSFGVFHNLGKFRGATFIHVSDMFHYYMGSKYFKELSHFDLYNAVLVADTEQGNQLARQPWYTDLRTYQNAQRQTALDDSPRIRALFSDQRWGEFKTDVAFFKTATGMPRSPGLIFLLMDHGYNGSPVSTFILGTIANIVPVTSLHALAMLDVLLIVGMSVLVLRTFGFEAWALFSVYFCVNVLNPYDFISGCFLRYDWLFYLVLAVCLLERRRYAWSAFFLTLSSMIRVFPVLLFLGIAVLILKHVRTTRAVDAKHVRFVATAAITGAALFVLPAASLGSVVQPWQEFAKRLQVHDDGVYVNHLGLRGIALFEPSHLSLDKFVEAYKRPHTSDIVRTWQDVKEAEFQRKKPVVVLASLLVFLCLAAVIWKRESEVEAVLWPLVLVYAFSFPSHYYYAFLSLFVLLFFRRGNTLHALVPLGLLLALNIGILVTDSFRPSPIVFYTLANVYLFVFVFAVLAFEIYASVLGRLPVGVAAAPALEPEPRHEVKRGRRPRQAKARK